MATKNTTQPTVPVTPDADAIAQALALLSAAGLDTSKVKVPETPKSLNGERVVLMGGELSKSSGKTHVYRLRHKYFGGQIWISPEVKDLSGFNGELPITFG